MINYPQRFKKFIFWLVFVLVSLCFIFIIIGFIELLFSCEVTNKQQAITDIIIPMICGLIWACIPIAMDNSLSNEKLKISLNRLEWRWKYHCIDVNWRSVDWHKSHGFDEEYKLISKNRWKSHKKILNEMIGNDYRETKYSVEVVDENITKEEFFINWIEDHFIY